MSDMLSDSAQNRAVLNVKEVALYLGVSESKVRQLVKRDAIPYVKIDGQYRFFLPTVEEWLREKTVRPVAETESDDAHKQVNRIWKSTVGE